MSKRYFHGGIGTLSVGMMVLPSAETGQASNADYGAAHVCRRDKVYVSTSETAASIFALMSPCGNGAVYEVEPIGTLEPDQDCDDPTLSFQCDRARVLNVRRLRFTKRQKATIIAAIMEHQA